MEMVENLYQPLKGIWKQYENGWKPSEAIWNRYGNSLH
jgi:hypothetical protein